jgi:formylglycine-generating enzyme required for sulfatase activity
LSALALIAVGLCSSHCDSTPHVHAGSLAHRMSGGTAIVKEGVCSDNGRCAERFCDQVPIGHGVFRMGSDDSTRAVPPQFLGGLDHYGEKSPERTVALPAFCIDKYEVTVARYAACVAAGECDPTGRQWPDNPVPHSLGEVVVNHYPPKCEAGGESCPYLPVNCKTYQQAATYCRWIGRRLCTEAEWERSARGPLEDDRSAYPWGDAPVDAHRANVPGTGPGHLVRVDRYPEGVSAEGLFNLVGNVFEWVSDHYSPYTASRNATVTKRAKEEGRLRIARGGCFFLKDGHNNTDRLTLDAAFDWGCIGFRCCSDQSSNRRYRDF